MITMNLQPLQEERLLPKLFWFRHELYYSNSQTPIENLKCIILHQFFTVKICIGIKIEIQILLKCMIIAAFHYC